MTTQMQKTNPIRAQFMEELEKGDKVNRRDRIFGNSRVKHYIKFLFGNSYSFCGRMSYMHKENSTTEKSKVTCKLCKRIMRQKGI